MCVDCMKKQPCTKCGQIGYKLGKISETGCLCKSCANHYRKKEICFECGKLAVLSKCGFADHNKRICAKCYSHYQNKVCPLCKRYRKLIATAHGQICQKCATLGFISCGLCGEVMPAGRGNKCVSCYYKEKVERKVNMILTNLKVISLRDLYLNWIEFYRKAQSNRKCFLKMDRIGKFVQECEVTWGCLPCYEELVSHFGPNRLRTVRLIKDWLIKNHLISIDDQAKAQSSMQKGIDNLLKSFECVPYYIQRYYDCLNTQAIKLRTIKLYLQPVVSIYRDFALSRQAIPKVSHIKSFLSKHPGQYANLSKFLSFLRQEGCSLNIHITKEFLMRSKLQGLMDSIHSCHSYASYLIVLRQAIKILGKQQIAVEDIRSLVKGVPTPLTYDFILKDICKIMISKGLNGASK